MINNEVIIKNNSKELTPKSSRDNNNKTSLENNFREILNEKSENLTEVENSIKNNSLNNKDNKSTNENNRVNNKDSELNNESTFEVAIKEVVNIISDEENFQGNNIDSEAMEELIALLNQIINLPEFNSLLPVKLEDPMFISNMINNINDELENVNNNKEVFNLVNTILETLESKNSNNILPEEQLNGFKEALELLSNNLLKQDTTQGKNLTNSSVLKPEIVNEKNIVENLKDIEEIDPNKVEVENILTDLKSNLDDDKTSESEKDMSKYGAISESSKDDKVLEKILGESENTVLNKENTFINRLNVKNNDVIKEPMVVNKKTMDADIIKNVKFMIKNAVSELKVKIYPKELGEMTIKLLSEEGILKADIKVISKETYNLLNSNLNDIKKTLEQQNIKIQEVNISLYSDDTTYYSGENARDEMFKNNENRQGRNSSNKSEYLMDEIEIDEKLIEENSIDQRV